MTNSNNKQSEPLHLNSKNMTDVLGILVISIISIIPIGLGILILCGWGDSLIAGYNTASKEEQQKFNIKRLRLVVALILFIVPVTISTPFFFGKEDNAMAHILTTIVCVVIVIIGVILANTWCKK